MIAEALHYAATWPLTQPAMRRHIRASINLWSRNKRCKTQWASHQNNSRSAILRAAESLKSRRTAVILGSGLCQDVPVEALCRLFDTVILVDLVHVAALRAYVQWKGLKNIRLIERDLSGFDGDASFSSGIAQIQQAIPEKVGTGFSSGIAQIQKEPLSFLRNVPYLDFVVSANLLSQLGRAAGRRVKAEPDRYDETHVQQVIAAHMAGLAMLPAKTCLITDIAFRVIDRNGKLHEETDLMAGFALPKPQQSWQWPVAPLGEESRDYQIVHDVVVIEDYRG